MIGGAVDPDDEELDDSSDERFEGHAPDESNDPVIMKQRWRDLFPDPIDASKNIGYPARDAGQYGSYPTHDGFNDDSEP